MMQLGCHEMPCHCNVIPLMEVETLAAETCRATSARPQQTFIFRSLFFYLFILTLSLIAYSTLVVTFKP